MQNAVLLITVGHYVPWTRSELPSRNQPLRLIQPGHPSLGRHMSTSLGWEGNCRFGVALAMRHRR